MQAAARASFLHVLLHVLGANLGAKDVALRICGDAFGRTRDCSAWRRIGNERRHRSVARAADADTTLPARMRRVRAALGGFGIGDVQIVPCIDEDAAGPAELLPLFDELTVLIENLNAIVAAIAYEEPPFRIECQRVWHFELPRTRSVPAPLLDELAVFCELDYTGVAASGAVAVTDKDVAVRCDRDGV